MLLKINLKRILLNKRVFICMKKRFLMFSNVKSHLKIKAFTSSLFSTGNTQLCGWGFDTVSYITVHVVPILYLFICALCKIVSCVLVMTIEQWTFIILVYKMMKILLMILKHYIQNHKKLLETWLLFSTNKCLFTFRA